MNPYNSFRFRSKMWVEDSQKDGDGVKVKVKLKPRSKESDKAAEEADGTSKSSRVSAKTVSSTRLYGSFWDHKHNSSHI